MKLRDVPCERCGWKYEGFHVCVDLSAPVDPKVLAKHTQRYKHSSEMRDRLSNAASIRWARHREDMAERDSRVVERYKEDNASMRDLAGEFGIDFQTVRNILHRAAARGECEIRPPGVNARFKKGYVT
jgi:hypothetical protein